jgi:hypothetical protein
MCGGDYELDIGSNKGLNREPLRKDSDLLLDLNLPEKDELLF